MFLATAVLCAMFAGAAMAADISGNWSGAMQAGNDPVPLAFAFKQDGEKLTGTVTSPQGAPLPLSDGKVVGDKVSFFIMADMGGNPTKFISEGVIKDDEITLTIKAEGGGMEFGPTVLKRVK
jgi:hypothetical protein